ncbi:MAG: 5'-nucleotidase C-terminal domain-containing protein [bacterium]|nr:5'-nucleotidase C-terminal domain-containing protein [bacterium]
MNYFKRLKRYLWILVALTLLLASCGKATENTSQRYDTTINFISFSDFHGAVDNATSSKNPGMDKFVAAIKDYTSKDSKEEGYVVVSGGDNYQGTAMSNLSHGKVINEMFREIGLTYSAIGNHEYDWGTGYFETWEKDGDFEFLAANIVDKKTGAPVKYAQPYGIVEKNGRKIGVIGISTPETSITTLLENVKDIEFTDPIEAVNKYAKLLREEDDVDAVVVLSHLGSESDDDGAVTGGEVVTLANKIEGVDAIFCGHTHNAVQGVINGVQIVGTTNNGRELGQVSLAFKGDDLTVTGKLDNLTSRLDDISSDASTKTIYETYEVELSPMLNQVITTLPEELGHDRNAGQTDLGQYSCKLLTEITGCQIGLFNAGGLRTSLEAGDVTVGDMYTIFPFDNTIVTMELLGADLKSNLEYGLNPENEVGTLQYYGINVTVDKSKEVGNRIVSITLLDGTKVEMDKYYTVATNNFLATNGDGFDFSNAKEVLDEGVVLRDAMIDAIGKADQIEFKRETNYTEK